MENTHLFSLLLLTSLVGCGSTSSDENETIMATIDTVPSLCSEYDQRNRTLCAPVFKDESGEPYSGIGGIVDFEYQFGTRYELLLEVIELDDPPADGFSIEYRIIEVLSEEQDPLGTTYLYEDVHLVDDAFIVIGDGIFSLPPYEMLCADDVDCETLANMANSGGIVSIELTMTGGEIPITLTEWN
ncbi:MAG: DUF4377 domain-containing protein [Pseudomonadota bacterium]